MSFSHSCATFSFSAAFISFVSSLLLIWIAKQGRQVRPSKEAPRLTSGGQPRGPVATIPEPGQSNGKVGTTEPGASSESRTSKVRPKSAAAVLLRREFRQGGQESVCFAGANLPHLIPPCAPANSQSFLGSEDFCDFMKLWYYHQLKKCREKDTPRSFVTEVQMETSEVKLPSQGEKQILPNSENSGAEEEDKGLKGFENPEPFLYLSIATAADEAVDKDPPNDLIIKNSGSRLAPSEASVPLHRSLTWPCEPSLLSHRSNTLNARDAFAMPFFPPTSASADSAGKSARDEKPLSGHSRKERSLQKGERTPEIDKEATLDLEAESPFEREAADRVSVGESEFDGRLKGQECSGKDDLAGDGSVEFNTEEKIVTRAENNHPVTFPQASDGKRGAHARPSEMKAPEHPAVLKSKQSLMPESSPPRARREVQPPLPRSDRASPAVSRREDASAENNGHSYINLLYEVVENRGRWTRERWKLTHQSGALHNRLAKPK